MCVGYITWNNYKAIIKPDAYVASSIADSLTRWINEKKTIE
jgi:predicted RNase H-related nuclease YkuK (DUF458 family)